MIKVATVNGLPQTEPKSTLVPYIIKYKLFVKLFILLNIFEILMNNQ